MGKLGARGRSDGTASENSFSNAAGSTIVLRDGALQHPESQGTQGKAADSWAVDKPRDTVVGSGLRGQGSDSKAAIQAANADGTVQQRPEVKQRPDEDLVLPKQVTPGRQKPQQQGQGLRQERPLPAKEQPEALKVVERPKKQQMPGKPGLPLDFDWQTYLLYNPELQQVSCDRRLPSASCRECPTAKQSLVMVARELVTMKQQSLLATPYACTTAPNASCLCLFHSLPAAHPSSSPATSRNCQATVSIWLVMLTGLAGICLQAGLTTQSLAEQHYTSQGRAMGLIYKRLRVLLRYTACTGLINQHYSHIAAFSLSAVLGAELVLPPAVKRDSFAHYFRSGNRQLEVPALGLPPTRFSCSNIAPCSFKAAPVLGDSCSCCAAEP